MKQTRINHGLPVRRHRVFRSSALSLIVLGSLLAGCSSSSSTPGTPGPAADDPAAVQPGVRPVINADVATLEPVDFTPPVGETQNLYDVLSASGTFTRLLALVEQAGLSETLRSDSPLTIFAPTDDAFAELDTAVGPDSLSALNAEELSDRLTYHAVADRAIDSMLLRSIDGLALSMANDLPAAVTINADGQLQINGAVIETPDLAASNGIAHIIGSVLTPPIRPADPNTNIPPPTSEDIATTLLRRSDYSTLLLLIEQAGLTESLQGDNDGQGWTLFAPSDTAFENVDLSVLDATASMELVQQHLYSGTLGTEDMLDGPLMMSLGEVQVLRSDSGLTVGGATIVGRDRVVGNGIIHFVNALLSPDVN